MKNNFNSIIVSIAVVVILLTALPIINSINKKSPVGNTIVLEFNSSSSKLNDYSSRIEIVQYMINSNNNWITIDYPFSNLVLNDVISIKFRLKVADIYSSDYIDIGSRVDDDDIFYGDNTLSESHTIDTDFINIFFFSYTEG